MRKYGVQLYGLRDAVQEDMKLALKAVADIGYKYVEFAGFFGHCASEVRSYLDEFGLEVSSTHTGISEITPENIEATIAYHKQLGNKNIVLPGYWMDTREDLDRTVETINFAIPLLEKEGIKLSVHNHYRELTPSDYGAIAHDELEAKTNVSFQLDTFWAFFAGKDPVALMEHYNSIGRLSLIHLKDGCMDHSAKALGEGEAPVATVLTKAIELGTTVVVESEGLNPTGLEENARCFDFLKNYELSH
ncbi:MAG: sugar phosphate isomerase/epimerase [Ruminococcaceae bacterium]|nr:sugar phosphate isomerase/epimerase [Oscillospiraceae bacterium]